VSGILTIASHVPLIAPLDQLHADMLVGNIERAWKAMEELQKAGLARS
jgi:diketogulonate reductase-like aldo/keto reductase